MLYRIYFEHVENLNIGFIEDYIFWIYIEQHVSFSGYWLLNLVGNLYIHIFTSCFFVYRMCMCIGTLSIKCKSCDNSYIVHWRHLMSLAPPLWHWLHLFWKKATKLPNRFARCQCACACSNKYMLNAILWCRSRINRVEFCSSQRHNILICFQKLHHVAIYKGLKVSKMVVVVCLCTFVDK